MSESDVGHAVRHAEKRRTATCRFADRIAQVSVDHYKHVVPEDHRPVAACVATIVAHDVGNAGAGSVGKLTVLGMGVGTKFLSESILNDTSLQNKEPFGARVRDCHAEVLARRAFRRHLSLEIFQSLEGTAEAELPSILERVTPSSYRLRRGVTLHFYTSSAPCGNAVLKKFATLKKEKFRFELGDDEWPSETHDYMPGHSINLGQFALLVKKDNSRTNDSYFQDSSPPMRQSLSKKAAGWPANTSDEWCPPGTTTVFSNKGRLHSCSDKILRWNCLGLQGSLLAAVLVEPLYLSTITVGRKLTAVCCRRAVCCRADRNKPECQRDQKASETKSPYRISHPAVMGTAVYLDETAVIDMSAPKEKGQDIRFHSSLSWTWWPSLGERAECIDGSTGWAVLPLREDEKTDDCANVRSQICTAALVELYLQIEQGSRRRTESGSGARSKLDTLEGLLEVKRLVSKDYEAAKENLLTKHPVLRQWKRRDV